MKGLYPKIEPWWTDMLVTGSKHVIYVEQSGNPAGIPVLFLHGGPCSGCKPDHRRFFDPGRYHIILFDQRGCGFSQPFAVLEDNTTQDLIADMERIRAYLGIEQWLLFGGSWGGTLALLYAQKFPGRALGLIIRGVFLARQKDLEWFIKVGAPRIYPEQWRQLLDSVSAEKNVNMVQNLHDGLWSEDAEIQRRIAKAWIQWGAQVTLGQMYEAEKYDQPVTDKMIQQVRMELHYALHAYFIHENQILENCNLLQGFPVTIIHGRNDLVCPVEAGYELSQALPGATFKVLPDAGHVANEESMIDALVSATDEMAVNIAHYP